MEDLVLNIKKLLSNKIGKRPLFKKDKNEIINLFNTINEMRNEPFYLKNFFTDKEIIELEKIKEIPDLVSFSKEKEVEISEQIIELQDLSIEDKDHSIHNYALFKTKFHQIEMVRDRGYEIEGDEKKLLELMEEENNPDRDYEIARKFYKQIYNRGENTRAFLSKNYYMKNKKQNYNKHLVVYFAYDLEPNKTKDLNAKSVDAALHNIKAELENVISLYNGITDNDIDIIIFTPLNISAEKRNKSFSQLKNFDIILEDDFSVNPTTHRDYSPHYLLSKEEKNKTLEEAGLLLKQIPVIRKSHPVAKWFGFKRGDLIMIERISSIPVICQKSIQYRHCV